MDSSVVDADQPNRRPNLLAAIGIAPQEPARRCLMITHASRKALCVRPLDGAGQHDAGWFLVKYGLFSTPYRRVLETPLRNLLNYKWLERVLCSFR